MALNPRLTLLMLVLVLPAEMALEMFPLILVVVVAVVVVVVAAADSPTTKSYASYVKNLGIQLIVVGIGLNRTSLLLLLLHALLTLICTRLLLLPQILSTLVLLL